MTSTPLILTGIGASAGLVGVFVGGWLTGRHQRAERRGVGRRLDHREDRLYPLYESLEAQFERLRRELKS